MHSNRRAGLARQQGFGLIEALVGSALLGVAMVVLVGSLSALLVGARTAQYRIVDERLAKNRIERLIAEPFTPCTDDSTTRTIDGASYVVTWKCHVPVRSLTDWLVEYQVTVTDSSGGSVSLGAYRTSLAPVSVGEEEDCC